MSAAPYLVIKAAQFYKAAAQFYKANGLSDIKNQPEDLRDDVQDAALHAAERKSAVLHGFRSQGRSRAAARRFACRRDTDRQSRRYFAARARDARGRRRRHRGGYARHQDLARPLWDRDAADRLSRA